MRTKHYLGTCLAVSLLMWICLGTVVTSAPAAKIKLRLSYWEPAEKVFYELVIQDFKKEHPNVDVILQQISDEVYFDKILTELAAGTGADIVTIDVERLGSWVDKGVLSDLTPYINESKTFSKDEYVRGVLGPVTFNGHQYAMVVGFYTMTLYYNKNIFDTAGLSYPPEDLEDTSWNWDALLNISKKLTLVDKKGKVLQWGYSMPLRPYILRQDLWSNGASIWNEDLTESTIDTPEAIEVLQSYQDFMYKYKVMPTYGEQQELGFWHPLMTGKVAMQWVMTSRTPVFKDIKSFEWDVSPVPIRKKRASIILPASSYAMNAHTKYPKETWEFLSSLALSEKGQIAMAKVGAYPSLKKLVSNPELWTVPGIHPKHMTVNLESALKYGRPQLMSRNPSKVFDTFNKYLSLLLTNEESAREMAPKLKIALDKVIKE